MAKKTIAQQKIEEMTEKGYRYIGMTTGTPTRRKGSNLARYLDHLKVDCDNVVVKTAARAGRNLTAGYQLLVFLPNKECQK